MKIKQRLDEWDFSNPSEKEKKYHLGQWDIPKRSTIHFEEYISQLLSTSKRVIDLGCGAGSSTYYLSQKHPGTQFIGIDVSEEFINISKKNVSEKGLSNISFNVDDWFDLNQYNKVDGVVSIQTLSWLPECEAPILEIIKKINPLWMSFTSLFYEGDISARTEICEHSNGKLSFYNHYSIPSIDRLCKKYGYKVSQYMPFEIDIDIDKPDDKDLMGTYTQKTEHGKRLQISGPLLMNWYFITIVKI